MSLFSLRSLTLVAALASALALSACTLTPLHADRTTAGQVQLDLAYAAPASRLEQVFYQALAARLGTSRADDASLVSANVSVSSNRIELNSPTRSQPAAEHEVIATVSYRIENNGTVLSSGTRTATAIYRQTGQNVADDAARVKADEDAVRAAAQSVIATILADPALQ